MKTSQVTDSRNGTLWKRTMELKIKSTMYHDQLQQKWISDRGKEEWRDIPTVEG